MSLLVKLRDRVRGLKCRVIFPEQTDPRVIEAVLALKHGDLCEPVLLSDSGVEEVVAAAGIECLSNLEARQEWRDKAIAALVHRQRDKGLTPQDAAIEIAGNPLLYAAALVDAGYVNAGVAGSVATAAEVLRAGFRGVGLAPGVTLVSSIFLMEWPDRVLTFGDCTVNPAPNAEQLAQIAIDSAHSHFTLSGEEPRVALLSFSTKGSAEHADVSLVREALALVRQREPELSIDGELQFDAALMPAIAATKAPGSAVAGTCNVFVFPNLGAGNIAYKITERLSGARAIGSVLQGMAHPWMDLSRGSATEDIVDTSVIAAVLCHSDDFVR